MSLILRRVLFVLAALSASASAQSQTHDAIALVHGYSQNGGSWVAMAPPLQATFGVPVFAPSLGGSASWANQSSALHGALTGRSSAFIVSHSNGGPVTRHYLRTFGGAARFTAHISLGSPHAGAPIAARVINGQLPAWITLVSARMLSTFNLYLAIDPALQGGLHPFVQSALEEMLWLLTALSQVLSALGYFYFQGQPALADLSPGSANVQALLDPGYLIAEAAAVPTRVSLVTELHPDLQPYSLFLTQQSSQQVRVLQSFLADLAWDLYDWYKEDPNPILQANAGNWAAVATDLQSIQSSWASMIGATSVGRGGVTVLTQSDGLIPWNRSSYPGAEVVVMSRSIHGDIPHGMQQFSNDVYRYVESRLRMANVPPYVPPDPEPPPPFTIFIDGPALARPGNTCRYTGGSTDAVQPISLNWSVNGVVVSTEASVDITFPSAGPQQLTLAVLDGSGRAWMKSHTVGVSSENSVCLVQ